jgi:hypothetical protein
MVASNVMRGDHPVEHWDSVDWPAVRSDPSALIVDVREVSSVSHNAGVWPPVAELEVSLEAYSTKFCGAHTPLGIHNAVQSAALFCNL